MRTIETSRNLDRRATGARRRPAVVAVAMLLFAACSADSTLNAEGIGGSGGPERDPRPTLAAAPGRAAPGSMMTKTDTLFEGTFIASDPSVVRDGEGYRMSFTEMDWNAKVKRVVIAIATSPDGEAWTPIEATIRPGLPGVVLTGEDGTWRENLEGSELVKGGEGWLLYFSGYRDRGRPAKGFPAALGVADSSDGVNFTPRPAPVIEPTQGWYDNDAVYSPDVLREGGRYHMVYAGHCYTDFSRIGRPGVFVLYASSTDGTNWTKGEKPLLPTENVPAWMKDGVAEPSLLRKPGGGWALFFTGLEDEERVIGLATAPALEGPWTIRPEPIVAKGAKGEADDGQVLAPDVMVEGGELRMWYLAEAAREDYAIRSARAPLAALTAGN